jgi:hypothetical protein
MDNEAGDDDDDEGDYSSYNIVSKRRSIEQNSDGSRSIKKNHVGENEDINHDASNISSNRSSGSSGIDSTGGTIKIDDQDNSSHVVTTYDGSSFEMKG